MISRLVSWTCPALLALLLGTGCAHPQLASRPMTPMECEWAGVIQRSYPRWKAPCYLPTRADWRAQPVHGVVVDGSAAAPAMPAMTAPAPTAGPEPLPAAGGRQTVIDVPFGAPSGPAPRPPLLPPVRVGTEQLNSPVTPPRADEPVAPPPPSAPAPTSLDDVEFVPADDPQ